MATNLVFVLNSNRQPLTPCHPARARKLLKEGKAAIFRRIPFVIILKEEITEPVIHEVKIKIDPGSKTTGFALVGTKNQVVFAMELSHRGFLIKSDLDSRRAIRRSRRNRKTGYRTARFNNRSRVSGWLSPSLQHRIYTTMTWVNRFRRWLPIDGISVESVKFDMQKMINPEISGVEYQQGELLGYDVREYLLEKFGRKCAYCDKTDTPLEIEHVVPRAKGGTNSVSNLTLACNPCNRKKGTLSIREFLKNDSSRLHKIIVQLKTPLRDAAAVNSTRNKLINELLMTGLFVETGTGAQTKRNRIQLGYEKAHWIDAACVGQSGESVIVHDTTPLIVNCMGHGTRQVTRVNRYGFPCASAKRTKQVLGIKTGDLVRLTQTKGKYIGIFTGRVSAIKTDSNFISLQVNNKQTWFSAKLATKLQLGDGYNYGIK